MRASQKPGRIVNVAADKDVLWADVASAIDVARRLDLNVVLLTAPPISYFRPQLMKNRHYAQNPRPGQSNFGAAGKIGGWVLQRRNLHLKALKSASAPETRCSGDPARA